MPIYCLDFNKHCFRIHKFLDKVQIVLEHRVQTSRGRREHC